MSEHERMGRLEADLSILAKQHGRLLEQQTNLDATLNRLLVKIDSHFIDSEKYEKNMTSIAENVQFLRVSYAEGPMLRHHETQKALAPVNHLLGEHATKLNSLPKQIMADVKTEARSHLSIIWLVIMVACGAGSYIYSTEKMAMTDAIKQVADSIENRPVYLYSQQQQPKQQLTGERSRPIPRGM